MFLHLSVSHSVHRGRCVWQGACVAGGHAWQRACMAGGHAWQGGMHGRGVCMAGGHVWQGGACMVGVCMAGVCVWWWGGMCSRGACMAEHGRYCEIQSMSGQCASYWNTFLFSFFHHVSSPTNGSFTPAIYYATAIAILFYVVNRDRNHETGCTTQSCNKYQVWMDP